MIRKLIVVLGNLGVIAAFVVAIFIMNAAKPKPERGTPQSLDPVVFVEEITYEPLNLTVFAQGEVRPKQQIYLTTQVGGKITDVSPDFANGGLIQKDQVLVSIEDADYRLAVTRAEAQVASASQALEIEKAESELAKRDYEELATTGLERSPSELTLRGPQLARAEADYNAALANLRDAELALERTKVRSPFNGRVRQISANIGQFVSPGFQIGEIFSTDVAEVRLPLTDEDLARLNLPLAFNDKENGPIVNLSTVVAGQKRSWTGRIVRVDAAIDASTRQIAAIVEVKDPYGAGAAEDGFPLAIGLFVDAEITGPQLDRATVVPRLALQNDGTVYTIDSENRVVQTAVTVAATTADGAVITSGLEEGDRVIVSRLTAAVGSTVRPLDPNDPVPQPGELTPEEEDGEAGASAQSDGGAAATSGNAGGL